MQTGPLIHDLPFPLPLRVALCAVGAFLVFICPYELWRGVWPLNFTTPFFGLLMAAGMSGGAMAIFTGLATPWQTLMFHKGVLEVREAALGRRTVQRFALADIRLIAPQFFEDSDGPDTWRVVIQTRQGQKYLSRASETERVAQDLAADFRRALGA
jgi:hypothetical protein